ncbi:ABC transporter ATP-binding protein [Halioxenophilus sp. WMMB6]|uniref:ABC transporter ATP-binding protein n=1 Tax=Halioxenophilus sp. WMMB6 TaxID=3073815 RepID=UPI00295E621C|nr:ABC transporter ATP-binding protein [Halioxenophilus sp. WMMB6]
MHIIEVSNLAKRVALAGNELTILSDIVFTITQGTSVAIIGASGSGKSTLLALLAGLDVPTTGQVYLAGQDITALDEDGRAAVRAERIGFVFQSFQLLPSLTSLENVMLPLELHGRADPEARAWDYLQRVGLEHRLEHYPKQLSGGEQQRVAIARAFASEPQILFADEPTGNLDSKTGANIIELLFELNQQQGTTLVLVTHEQRLADRCDRQITLEAGRIIADVQLSPVAVVAEGTQ